MGFHIRVKIIVIIALHMNSSKHNRIKSYGKLYSEPVVLYISVFVVCRPE